jgi:hypothetical protein
MIMKENTMQIPRTSGYQRNNEFEFEPSSAFTENTGMPRALSGYDGRFWTSSDEAELSSQGLIARVDVVETIDIDHCPYLKLGFALMEGASYWKPPSQVIWAWCLPQFYPGSTLWTWAKVLLFKGQDIPDDVQELDTDRFRRIMCELHLFPNGAIEIGPMPSFEEQGTRAMMQLYLARTSFVPVLSKSTADGTTEMTPEAEMVHAMYRAAKKWIAEGIDSWRLDWVADGDVHPTEALETWAEHMTGDASFLTRQPSSGTEKRSPSDLWSGASTQGGDHGALSL